MDDELIPEKTWWQNRRWHIAALVVLMAFIITIFIGGIAYGGDFAKAYADKPLYENAHQKAQQDKRVVALLGDLQPISSMAIAEGAVEYADDGNTITATITIKGSKAKGKMDIAAQKTDGPWKYNSIKVRTKNPDDEIIVL